MSMFRKLAGAFVELEPEAQAATTATPSPAAGPAAAKAAIASVPAAAYAPIPLSINEEMVNALVAVSTKRATAYTAFIDASKKLEAVLPDENTRLKAAFVTVNGEGRSIEQMLQAIDVHVMDVNAEVDKFNRVSDANMKTEVEQVNAKAQGLLNENDQIASQIASLQSQIAALTSRSEENTSTAATLTQQAAESAAQIALVKEQFSQAAEHVKQNLTGRKAMLSALIVK